ncbi:MAG TPA: hypothetical protein VNQ78_08485 [Paracoccus sp. (in: a-proteobacteria)]|uniref:hypothetical protein n=1 Tax=Paracoccus sp. TaxID=267 RepID=UPI002BE4370B|nr:hypothetical protein [Paracoccus sp. (in: a-proteobacteria)]HWL56698.1 hypothetical protein [Paracoccus sp. (in: a-proteobacteria)]
MNSALSGDGAAPVAGSPCGGISPLAPASATGPAEESGCGAASAGDSSAVLLARPGFRCVVVRVSARSGLRARAPAPRTPGFDFAAAALGFATSAFAAAGFVGSGRAALAAADRLAAVFAAAGWAAAGAFVAAALRPAPAFAAAAPDEARGFLAGFSAVETVSGWLVSLAAPGFLARVRAPDPEAVLLRGGLP